MSAAYHPHAGAVTLPQTGLTALLLVIGLVGLVHDAWQLPLRQSASLHALFGASLWICVVARFYERVHRTPGMPPNDIRAFARELSRMVYLLLYALMFFYLSIGILRSSPNRVILAHAENFRSYLAYGLLALVTIRAQAALLQHSAVRGTSIPQGSAQRNGRLR